MHLLKQKQLGISLQHESMGCLLFSECAFLTPTEFNLGAKRDKHTLILLQHMLTHIQQTKEKEDKNTTSKQSGCYLFVLVIVSSLGLHLSFEPSV